MGLMQLLAIGSSLGKTSDQTSRYKLTQQSLLPKLGTAPRPDAEAAPAPKATPKQMATVGSSVGNAARKSAENKQKTMKTIEAEAAEGRVVVEATKQAFPLGRWTIFKNPFSRMPKPVPVGASPSGQLLLDLVKPIRNDLSDSDLELVTADQPAAGRTTVPAIKAPRLESSELVWNQIKTQLFGAGKV